VAEFGLSESVNKLGRSCQQVADILTAAVFGPSVFNRIWAAYLFFVEDMW
jgi:hypothetical protein